MMIQPAVNYPSVRLSEKDLPEIMDIKFGNKIKIQSQYEVVSKTEYGMTIRLSNITLKTKTRTL